MQKPHMDTAYSLVIAAKSVGRENELEICLIPEFPGFALFARPGARCNNRNMKAVFPKTA